MRIDIVTIFPEMFRDVFEFGILSRARERGIVDLSAHDLRKWTTDRHRTTDDSPYGGGPGMVMKAEPLVAAIEAIAGPKGPNRRARVALLTPQGRRLEQHKLAELSREEHLVLVCGRYEGIDQRAIELAIDEEISIGDYVLSGGEVPAMALIEGVARLIPGVLGNPESLGRESFQQGGLEGPQFTRPVEFRGLTVPDVLLSGDHAAVEVWRSEQARELTGRRRPDLIRADSQEEE